MTSVPRCLLVPFAAVGWSLACAQSASEVSPRVEAELLRCRAIAEAIPRVACYDAITLPALMGAAATGRVATVAAATAPASGVAAPAPASAAAGDATRQFGMGDRPATPLPQSIESAIEGDFDGWAAGTRLRLANGQVWEVVDGSTAGYRLRNPKVRISRGMLGSFFLHLEGVSQSPRVRRVQ
jgi:hypothetical protein